MAHKGIEGRRILIVDDDMAVATVVRQGLEYLGCRVFHALTGEKGIEFARTENPDLIVLDVSLPTIDGLEVCRRLKADEETRDIPVIFLSALDETKERVRGLRSGAIDYIVKPFDMDELIERTDIGLRVKSTPTHSSAQGKENAGDGERRTKPKESVKVLDHDEFLRCLEDRYEKLDPENGLLTLVFIRVDQEEALSGEEHAELREEIVNTLFALLKDLCPKGTLFGRINSLQVGVLIPRKNKYGAELILDELSNLLALEDFHSEDEISRLTLSSGVAEIPSPVIASAKEFEETANAALHRAVLRGGDRAVLL